MSISQWMDIVETVTRRYFIGNFISMECLYLNVPKKKESKIKKKYVASITNSNWIR